MLELNYDKERHIANGGLFPEDIEYDLNTIFHGTSSMNEATIERDGFQYPEQCIPRSALEQICSIYQTMSWYGWGEDGRGSSGYSILKPFSIDHDLSETNTAKIFFREESERAAVYATQGFAGGEKVMAARECLRDLHRYIEDPAIREQHKQELQARNTYKEDVDLDWLANELESLSDFELSIKQFSERFEYGIVYAVKLTPDDCRDIACSSTMGIQIGFIAPDRIIAKLKITPDSGFYRRSSKFEHALKAHEKLKHLQELSQQGNKVVS